MNNKLYSVTGSLVEMHACLFILIYTQLCFSAGNNMLEILYFLHQITSKGQYALYLMIS